MELTQSLRSLPSACVLLAAAVLVAPNADAQSKASTWYKGYGSGSVATGWASAYAGTDRFEESYVQYGALENRYALDVGANAKAGIKVLGYNVEAFRMEVAGHMEDDSGTLQGTNGETHALLRIAGLTYVDYNKEFDLTYTKNFGPYSIMKGGVKSLWWLGPVPITVGADAGNGNKLVAKASLNPFENDARGTVAAVGWQYGKMWAGVGGWLFTGGISATLEMAHTTLSYTLRADLEEGVSGYLQLVLEPIALYLKLFAKVNVWWWKQTWTKTIYKWSAGKIGATYPLH